MKPTVSLFIIVFSLIGVCWGHAYAPVDTNDYTDSIRVACVGDSITYGAGIKNRGTQAYPPQLERMLGRKWIVQNFGISGATLLNKGDNPYCNLRRFQEAKAFAPDVVVIKLGSNDSKPQNWKYGNDYRSNYLQMVEAFQSLPSQPRIWLCLPAPAFQDRWGINQATLTEEIMPLVKEVAEQEDIGLIDTYSIFAGQQDLFPDKIHPNASGATLLARAVYRALRGSDYVENPKKTRSFRDWTFGPNRGRANVLIIGDSISIGYGLDVRRIMEKEANVYRPMLTPRTVQNGGDTRRGLENLDVWLGDTYWDVIHFNFGLHDLKYVNSKGSLVSVEQGKQNLPLVEYEQNLQTLVDRLKRTRATLIWASTTPVPAGSRGRVAGDAARYNEVAARVMKQNGIQIDDLYSYVKPHLADYQLEANVHFNAQGSRFLAERVAEACRKALRNRGETITLWPDGAPGAMGYRKSDIPTLTLYRAPEEKSSHSAIVVCPGGGYGGLAIEHEGYKIVQWLNSLGITAAFLTYRNQSGGYGFPAPQQDVQRAIRIMRARADELNVARERIGVLGFSAGGHLAASATTLFNESFYAPRDNIDQQSCRPDFSVLIYPVISMRDELTHKGSQKNLLGDPADPNLIRKMSNELQVTKETPPVFLVHTDSDKVVKSENSVAFYLALKQAGVPAELHIYQRGAHGFGLGDEDAANASWTTRCRDWLTKLKCVRY